MANDQILEDEDEIESDTVTIVYPEPTRLNPYLAIIYLLAYAIPAAQLLQGQCIGKCLETFAIGNVIFQIAKLLLITDRHSISTEALLPSTNVIKDLCSLYLKSLVPSFRLEHLLAK